MSLDYGAVDQLIFSKISMFYRVLLIFCKFFKNYLE